MDLVCSTGLSGSAGLDIKACLKRLDAMAASVEFETSRHAYRFREHPEAFRNSEGYFKMLFLFTVLQQDYGIHYNPARITDAGVFEPNSVFFADSRDIFIHGLLDPDRRTGTCASMPVLYLAVGRRLHYPLFLAPTKNHLFIRWEDRRERFNVDGTAVGLSVYDDDRYRQWPLPVTKQEEDEFGYLRSMTSAEELAAFLTLRGHCLFAAGRLDDGLACFSSAVRLAPGRPEQALILADARREVAQRRVPPSLLPPEQVWLAQAPNVRTRIPLSQSQLSLPDPNPLVQLQQIQNRSYNQ